MVESEVRDLRLPVRMDGQDGVAGITRAPKPQGKKFVLTRIRSQPELFGSSHEENKDGHEDGMSGKRPQRVHNASITG